MNALPVVRRRGTCCALPATLDRAWSERAADVLKALGDTTRLGMVAALRAADEAVCVCDFTAAFQLSQPTISHHMARLAEAGLVESEKRGVWIHYRMRTDLPPEIRRTLDALLD